MLYPYILYQLTSFTFISGYGEHQHGYQERASEYRHDGQENDLQTLHHPETCTYQHTYQCFKS